MDKTLLSELDKLDKRLDNADKEKTLTELLVGTKGILKPKSTTVKIGCTFGELQKMDLPKRIEIINGLARGENGLLNAVTNVGKTTLIRNLALNLILGRPFEPLTGGGNKYRVAIIDNEDTQSFLRLDLTRMMCGLTEEEKDLIRQNLFLICEVSFGNEDLKLDKPEHFNRIRSVLSDFNPDIVFIDTISATFAIRNENDNSEVKEHVMKPLKQLARLTNAAVLASHHIGKARLEEGVIKEAAHRGRGASAFSDLSRIVFNLEKDTKKDSVILSCGKIKGEKFPNAILTYDKERRLFSKHSETTVLTNYESLLKVFADGKTFKPKELQKLLNMPHSTLTRILRDAVERGDLSSSKGIYSREAQRLITIRCEPLSLSENSNTCSSLQADTKNNENNCEPDISQEELEGEVEYF